MISGRDLDATYEPAHISCRHNIHPYSIGLEMQTDILDHESVSFVYCCHMSPSPACAIFAEPGPLK